MKSFKIVIIIFFVSIFNVNCNSYNLYHTVQDDIAKVEQNDTADKPSGDCIEASQVTYFKASLFDEGNGIIKDTRNNLFWLKCPLDENGDSSFDGALSDCVPEVDNETVWYNWQEAINSCDSLSFNGMDNWQLPTFYQLLTIKNQDSELVLDKIFSVYLSNFTWSSNKNLCNEQMVWGMNFGGVQYKMDKTGRDIVRCVKVIE